MKKFGIVVLSFLVSFSLISATFAADLFEKDVKYGVANNNDVRQLQDFLYNEGYYKGPVTGNFYTLTRNALKKYQLANKITPANGLLNKVTREKLNSTLLAQENASEEVLGGDDMGYTADDEAARLAWVARMTSMQTQSVPQQPMTQSTPQPIINNYYTSPVTYNVLPVVTSSPQVVQNPQPTPNQVVTTTQTTSTPVVTTTPPVVVTNINWNMGGLSVFGSGYDITSPNTKYPFDNGDGTYTIEDKIPYYYGFICGANNPFPTWGSMSGYAGLSKNVPNDTLGKGTVIEWRTEIVASFYINGPLLDQYTNGPFIKSVTIKNLGTADLSKIGLYGFNSNFTDGLRIEPSNTTSNTATFTFPSSIKYLGLGFKIDSSKMNRGETLNLQATNVELTSPDPTKNYIYTYPTVDSSTKTLIKCDNRV